MLELCSERDINVSVARRVQRSWEEEGCGDCPKTQSPRTLVADLLARTGPLSAWESVLPTMGNLHSTLLKMMGNTLRVRASSRERARTSRGQERCARQ